MHGYLKAIRQYFDFTERARRSEYWYFVLFNFLFSLVPIAFDAFYGFIMNVPDWETTWEFYYPIYTLLTFIPTLTVTVRRPKRYRPQWMVVLNPPYAYPRHHMAPSYDLSRQRTQRQ